ncbi:lysophospholipid acyltransferase family protein [Kroppenstedtia eburnea]|uniref:1-acyl-sn-glycerol-3-phosphate acyltransferase n=1 Tax=Kroppenstedtia eburnea TaxID=714067 RepID=A0A1N7JI15_9BACL|nr:lysophospholipid acyltransferase family protein [Kroppenstedtia eburnea]EGK10374.1 1-acylglycerol-3-phosphate O-acyltransferase [Desmospora sp. 8437]QKI83594.1 1-acyl-sn-glycerol-3-phosphate acyltransferase [Kroppenstedtia eburnea]SIS48904.1 1-acyl-sn-glycerol-3-phosphate acyltransferase [Kroppenstedtia eburnea]
MYRVIQKGIRLFLRFYHRLEIEGLEHVPTKEPFLVVGNHISVLDPFYIAAVLPGRVSFMAKEESFSHPVSRWFLDRVGAFPVNRGGVDTRSLRTALALLKEGKRVGIFPEGGRRESDPLKELKDGAAWLAIRSQVPILPVVIEGTDEALPRGSRWLRPAKIRIRFGGLLSGSSEGNPRETQDDLTAEILTSFRSLRSEVKAVPR